MAYDDPAPPDPEPRDTGPGIVQIAVAVLVRLVGLGVLLLGLWIAAKVLFEAWALYQEPARIERFAEAIERGSNLDRTFSAAVDRAIAADTATAGQTEAADEPRLGAESGAPAATAAERRGPSLRLSYFAAWVIVLLLLLIVGSLAMSAITTGGQLALYDMQVKRFSREVVREIARHRGAR